MSPVLLFLVQSAILIAVPVAIWNVPVIRRRIPLVVAQIILGIALGPTLLAKIAPTTSALVLPGSSLERLLGVSWLGAAFFSFLTGLHLDTGEIAGKSRAFLVTALSSMITPFILGLGVGAWAIIHVPELIGPNARPSSFVLAIGLSVSATALPVLGAILREMGLIKRELGRLAIGYAAVNDVLLWFAVIALLTTIDAANSRIGTFAATVLSTLLFFGLMAFVVRPLLARLFVSAPIDRCDLADSHVVLIALILLVSALATEALGLHYLIGAFTAGAAMPKSAKESIRALFEPVTVFVLLPFYFMATGLKVTLDFHAGNMFFFFVISTLAAMLGKILGTAVPARLTGHRWRDAIRLGALMQCKGFIEVIILNVLLDAGLISSGAFSALILMAVVTTALTMPLVQALEIPAARSSTRAEADPRAVVE
jgi:Kef-type K+ transport system membrane component KefB